MKRLIVYISLTLLCFTASLSAQKNAQKVDTLALANDMYKQANYTDAAKMYESQLQKGVSAELYYNLANAYYKSGEVAHAILNYERALRLKPNFADAKFNLKLAQQKVVDSVNASAGFFVKRWAISMVEWATSNQWAITSILTFILSLALFLLFLFSKERQNRKIAFYTAFVFITVSGLTFILSGIRKDQMVKHHDAIIMNGAVTAKSSPDKSGTDIFQLHEGTKVEVKSTLSNWAEIEIENGAIGWVEESAIERI